MSEYSANESKKVTSAITFLKKRILEYTIITDNLEREIGILIKLMDNVTASYYIEKINSLFTSYQAIINILNEYIMQVETSV